AVEPYAEDSRSPESSGVQLSLRSGEQVRLLLTLQKNGKESVAILKERIREAMERHQLGEADADAALLRGRERSVSTWITALRCIGAGANADHRVAPVAPERLWRIMEAPSAQSTVRVAAAVALGAKIDDAGRARLRAAAAATAAPKLRIAL